MALMALLCLLSVHFRYYYYHTLGIAIWLGVAMFFVNRLWDSLGCSHVTRSWKRGGILLLMVLPAALELFAGVLTGLVLPHYYGIVLGPLGAYISVAREYRPALWLTLLMAVAEEVGWRAYFQSMLIKLLKTRAVVGILLSAIIISIAGLMLRPDIKLMPLDVVVWEYVFVFIQSLLFGVLFYRTKSLYVVVFSHILAIVLPCLIFL